MCFDGDGFYTVNAIERYRAVCQSGGAVFSYKDNQPRPIFSYVQIDGSEFGKNRISSIAEKVKVSDYANTGTYCFRSGTQLMEVCRSAVDAFEKSDEAVRSELFTSAVISSMIAAGEEFTMLLLNPGNFHSLGTPALIQSFVSTWQHKVEKKRFCFDMENMLITLHGGDLRNCTPIKQNVEVLRRLHLQGNTIILQTSMQENNTFVIQVLKELDIPFHEVHFGKPKADFYIDDEAVFSGADLVKELGYYDIVGECDVDATKGGGEEGGGEDDKELSPIVRNRTLALVQVAKEEGDVFLSVETGLPVMQLRQMKTYFLFDIDGTLVGTDPLYLQVGASTEGIIHSKPQNPKP
jgi:hypothetical protein